MDSHRVILDTQGMRANTRTHPIYRRQDTNGGGKVHTKARGGAYHMASAACSSLSWAASSSSSVCFDSVDALKIDEVDIDRAGEKERRTLFVSACASRMVYWYVLCPC